MKKVLIVLLAVILIFAFTGCKSAEQRMVEEAYKEAFNEAAGNGYNDTNDMGDMEPNDDGFDEDYQNEVAGVDDGDGNGEEMTDTEENSITLGGGEWPDDAPSEIPVFDKAAIAGVVASSNGVVITFTEVAREDGALYIQGLIDSGWTLIAHTDDSDWETYSGQMGNIIVSVEWDLGDMCIVWETV